MPQDKSDLKACMLEAKESINAEELKLTGKETPEFWNYLDSHKKMMTKSMIATARSKAGMAINVLPETLAMSISHKLS